MSNPIDLDDKIKQVSGIYPVRNPVRWRMRDGKVVITYKKEFRSIEKFLHDKLGGPDHIRRPLDELGTRIWLLSDGRRSLKEICVIMDDEFKERIEPAFKRVWRLIEILINTGMMRLEREQGRKLPRRVAKK